MGIRKKFAVAAAAGVLVVGGGAEIATHVIAHPRDSSGGVASFIYNTVQGQTDITGYLTPTEVNLLKNNATDKDMLTVLNGLQSAVSAAQRTPGSSQKEQKDLASIAQLLSVLKPVVQGQGMLPISDLSSAQAAVHNKKAYEAAAEDLAKDLAAGNPAMVSFAQTLASDAPALKAVKGLVVTAFAPEVQALSQLVSRLSPAQKAEFSQVAKLLKDNLTDRDLLNVLAAAQSAIVAAQQSPAATQKQQHDLAVVAELLSVIKPVVQHNGAPSADFPAIENVLKNKKEYANAIVAIYKDFKAADPAMAAFKKTFATDDPAIISFAKTLARTIVSDVHANATQLAAIEQSVMRSLPSLEKKVFQAAGVSQHAQNSIGSYLPQGNVNVNPVAQISRAFRRV